MKATVFSDESLDKQLETLWAQEIIPEERGPHTPDELSAITQYQDTYVRLPTGQYSVALPRRSPAPKLGASRLMAHKRYVSNERSLKRMGQWEAFEAVLQE